jgi:RNA polymerase sigma-70 factor (ECF subfamily)
MDDLRLESLVTSFQKNGSDEFFVKLYTEFSLDILKYLHYLTNNESDAQDLSQEVWIKVIKKRNSLKTPVAFKQWLYRIAKTTYINHFNQRKNDMLGYGLDSTSLSEEENILLINDEDKERVQKIISNLSEDKKTILWLRTVEEYSNNEIATILKLPVGTVRSRFHYIIEEIKKKLKKDEPS